LVPKGDESKYMLYDSINKYLFTHSYFKDKMDNNNHLYRTLKVDILGNVVDSFKIYTTLKDGTMWDWEHYNNWIINGDTEEHNFLDPLSSEEKNNLESWMKKLKELYAKSSYVYLYSNLGYYYFKIENQWYKVNDNLENRPSDLYRQYPAKEDNDVRMIELEDLCPSFWSNPKTRDVSLIRELDYEVVDFEKGKGLNPINYSAGNYYFEVYMPGETITFKRYGAMGEHIKLYKIPTEYGGREDVLFIVLEPRNSDARQASGMYVIRPRGIDKEKASAQ
jgi:hypothetical protein